MLEEVYYNLVRVHKIVRQEVVAPDHRWLPRTLAMAFALTDHIWIVKELFSKIPVPIVLTIVNGKAILQPVII